MSRIIIKDLEVHYRVGVPDEERAQPQRLLITLEMDTDFTLAIASDDVAHTINYYDVTRRLLALGEGRSWKLIESVAAEIARIATVEFKAEKARVEVKKFIIKEADWVAVRHSRDAEV